MINIHQQVEENLLEMKLACVLTLQRVALKADRLILLIFFSLLFQINLTV